MSDVLGDLLRAARPSDAHRDDPLSARGLRELAAYEAAEEALVRRRRDRAPRRPARLVRRVSLATGSAALIVIAITVVVLSLLRPAVAVAHTPPLLELRSIPATASELLMEMDTMRRGASPTGDTIRAQSWSLNTSINEDGTIESSVLEPEWIETTFEADGTVRYRSVAAEPFPGQDTVGLPEPGTVLVDETFSPGTWDFVAQDGPPADAGAMREYLADFAGSDDLTTGETLREVMSILSIFPLTREQEAAIIGYLATIDGITIAGETTDRLGRAGVVFRASDRSPGEFEDLLVVSRETGHILAAETLYVGTERTDIDSPSVISYIAWER